MTRFLSNVRTSVVNTLVNCGRARARAELLRLDDRVLADAGFSRILLESGTRAWPWRADDEMAADRRDALEMSQRRAERELARLSNRELDDLAIARADIARAVREGRPGIDVPARADQVRLPEAA